MTAEAIRRVHVQVLSAGAELGNVLRLSMVIVVGVWMFLASDSAALKGGVTGQRNLLPFQALVQDRPSSEQRIFRELQEGLLEAEARRANTGTWPAVPALSGEGIPPFAADPTAKGSRYDWRLIQSGTFVNYLGIPERPDAPAWLLLVLEPEAGAAPDPAREDEEHHRLMGGTMLHVSTWVHPSGGQLGARVVRSPQAEGWTQLYGVGPSVLPTGR
jgi:hypothetical protein